MSADSFRVRITTAYLPQYSDPIQVRAGERVTIGDADPQFPGWKWCRARDGREGWVPAELIANDAAGVMLQDYSAQELAVASGEEVRVEDRRHGWLLVRNDRGERGWIPESVTGDSRAEQGADGKGGICPSQ